MDPADLILECAVVIFFDDMMKRSLYFLIAVLLLSLHPASAQITGKLTIDDGLSQNYIYDILQDKRGFLWFGTKEGLNRYDGYSFVVYRNDPFDPHSLSNNTVTALHEDRSGTLWVGTIAGGLNRFDRMTETFTRIAFKRANNATGSAERITSILSSSDGMVWICTYGSGLVRYNPLTGEMKSFLPDSSRKTETLYSNIVLDVAEREGKLWIATTGALSSFDLQTEKMTTFVHPEVSRRNGMTTVVTTSRNELLVAHRNGVDLFDRGHFIPFYTANDSNQWYWTTRIKEDRQGNLWFTTMQRILKYNPNSKEFSTVATIQSERFTRGLHVDPSNVVWCGTTGWGVYISNQNIRRFGAMKGTFLDEVFGKEISLVNDYLKRNKIISDVTFSLRGGLFPSCMHDRAGNSWLLTNLGLFFYEKQSLRMHFLPTNPLQYKHMPVWSTSHVYEDRKGAIWIGTVGGISRLDRQRSSFEYYRLYADSAISGSDLNQSSYKDVTAMFQDRDGIFWVGTPANGLIRFNPATREVKYFVHRMDDSLSLSNNHLLTICEDPFAPDSVLWIGTDGGGVSRFNTRSGRFLSLTQRNGFPNNVVYGIMADKNKFLWMSTNNGLIKMNPRTLEWRQYDVSYGLQSNEFNRNEYYKTSDGTMYFGGIYGYNAFVPETIVDNPVVPNVVLIEFSIFNRTITHRSEYSPLAAPISETRRMTLDYSQNMFTFEFAALEFSAPAKNQYAYKLEGFNDDWIYAGTRRQATYTNLDPGEYTFHVKASNSDGVWNDKGVSLAVAILPPFYMTWWFRGIIILFFVAAGPSVYFLRVTQLKKERRRQQEVSQLLIQSQEQERKRIAQEMHDVLGQELLVIKNRAIMGMKSSSDSSKEKKQLEQISESASTVLKTVREISHNLRPPELDRLGLTETLRSIVVNIADVSPFTVHGNIDFIDGLVDKENEINVVRIVQEALNNIVKYAEPTKVTVHIAKTGTSVSILVKDNGKGFVAHAITPGMGLAGISERVRILHGAVKVHSEPGQGTTVNVEIPVGKVE